MRDYREIEQEDGPASFASMVFCSTVMAGIYALTIWLGYLLWR